MKSLNHKFMIALQGSNTVLPEEAVNAVKTAQVELAEFDRSYLDFLDQQINLEPRGPDWTAILKARRKALAPYCGKPRLRGDISLGNQVYTINVDVESLKIIHVETYDVDSEQ